MFVYNDEKPNFDLKPMRKTFTLILFLFLSVLFFPKHTWANFTIESAYTDVRYGEKDMVKLYPNPLVSESTIKINDELNLETSKVSIVFYNILGSEIYKINQMKDYEQKISRELFKNTGIYFYQLKVEDKIISTGRFTVK